jgi:uncharacterized protein YjbI with pentapeptide repeats
MKKLGERIRFLPNEADNSLQNFQDYIFENINLSNDEKPKSFFRSDFRGVLFDNSVFYHNDFSRADFINVVSDGSKFTECEFAGTEMYNTQFLNSVFQLNAFKNLTFTNCNFLKAKLAGNSFLGATLRNCTFVDSELIDCSFERSSIDNITFRESAVRNVDLSNMFAVNLYFANCSFEKVTVDADYLGSYCFQGKMPDDISWNYRGKEFDLKTDRTSLLQSFSNFYYERGRVVEFLNTNILLLKQEEKPVEFERFLLATLQKLDQEKNEIVKDHSILKSFLIC